MTLLHFNMNVTFSPWMAAIDTSDISYIAALISAQSSAGLQSQIINVKQVTDKQFQLN